MHGAPKYTINLLLLNEIGAKMPSKFAVSVTDPDYSGSTVFS